MRGLDGDLSPPLTGLLTAGERGNGDKNVMGLEVSLPWRRWKRGMERKEDAMKKEEEEIEGKEKENT